MNEVQIKFEKMIVFHTKNIFYRVRFLKFFDF